MISRLRRAAGGANRQSTSWSSHRRMADQAWLLVQCFYLVCLALQYGIFNHTLKALDNLDADVALWPVAWAAPYVGDRAASVFIVFTFSVGLLAVFAPRYRSVRCLAALSALFHAALLNSSGSISHSWHEMVWIAAMLCLLPSNKAEGRSADVQSILVVASVCLMILFFYSLSGAYKFAYAIGAAVQGEFGGFSPFAMAHTVARRAMQTLSAPPLADLIVYNPWLGWPLYLSTYYIELFAILIAFRPRLIRLWGVLLIAFHLGTAAFLNIAFPQHVIWNGLFMVMAPHARVGELGTVLSELPLLGYFFRPRKN